MNSIFRIGISTDFYEQARPHLETVLRQRFHDQPGFAYEELVTPDRYASPEQLNKFDAVFAMATRIDESSLQGVSRLALVARWGVGYDRIDVDALTAHDVMLTITPRTVRRPVAEAIFTFIFALAKNLPLQDRTARAGLWRGDLPKLGITIQGRTLGSVGCGNIAREMFRMAPALGFSRLLACDPFVTQDQVQGAGIEIVDMDTVFRESDFVAVNTFLNASTRGLVKERHFRLMKPTAFFINTARGPIVQHDALVRALKENWIAAAGIDVFPIEPPANDDPLFSLDNVIVAPHAMAWTNELMVANGNEASDAVVALSHGILPESIVNRAVLDRPGFQAKLKRYDN
jgi:phosphoglycerate dehydrogenase-like enzyme